MTSVNRAGRIQRTENNDNYTDSLVVKDQIDPMWSMDTIVSQRERRTARSVRQNQESSTRTAVNCAVSITRNGETISLFIDDDTSKQARLHFVITGGTDNPSFELSLGPRETRTNVPQRKQNYIIPREGFMTAKFPAFPNSGKEILKCLERFPREVIPRRDIEHQRDGVYDFSTALGMVSWRDADPQHSEKLGFPEAIKKWFEQGTVRHISWSTQDTILLRKSLCKSFTFTKLAQDFLLLDLAEQPGYPAVRTDMEQAIRINVWARTPTHIEESWRMMLASPDKLATYWRDCRTDLCGMGPSCFPNTLHDKQRETDGSRGKNWLENYQPTDKSKGTNELVPIKPISCFDNVRHYEAHIKASFLKDIAISAAKYQRSYNRDWHCVIQEANKLVARANPEVMIVIAKIDVGSDACGFDDNEDFPPVGEHVSLHFPSSMFAVPTETLEEEVWAGYVIEYENDDDRFNLAALVTKPNASKVRVFNESGQEVFFRFGHTSDPSVLADRFLFGLNGYPTNKSLLKILLGQDNHQPLKDMGPPEHLDDDEKAAWSRVINNTAKGSDMDRYQEVALQEALKKEFTLIKGPPGTGKTRTLARIVQQFYMAGECVLVLVPSRKATEHVGNVLHRLWIDEGYEDKDLHWTRRAEDDSYSRRHGGNVDAPLRPTPAPRIINIPAHRTRQNTQLVTHPSGPIQGAEFSSHNGTPFNSTIEEQIKAHIKSSDHPIAVSTRILGEINKLATKSSTWTSKAAHPRERELENKEFKLLWNMRNLISTDGGPFHKSSEAVRQAIKECELDLTSEPKSFTQSASRHRKALVKTWKKLENFYVAELSLVALSTIGNSLVTDAIQKNRFETLIIDEAANISEWPLVCVLGRLPSIKRIILIGDEEQLPATVQGHHQNEMEDILAKSMFERLVETGMRPITLRLQRRMHKDIAHIISHQGYRDHDGRPMLQTHTEATTRPIQSAIQSWARTTGLWGEGGIVSTSRFVHVPDGVLLRESKGTSKVNFHNALTVLELCRDMVQRGAPRKSIMVIAMYKAQVRLILALFKSFGLGDLAVVTVDGSQAKEASIVLVDIVTPARNLAEIGFLGHKARINVALSRAMDCRIVIGHANMCTKLGLIHRMYGGVKMLLEFAKSHQGEKQAVFNITREHLVKHRRVLKPYRYVRADNPKASAMQMF